MKKKIVIELKNDGALEDFLTGDEPRVLEISVNKCHPCNKVTTIVRRLARNYAGRVVFGRVDISECKLACKMMDKFEINGVPAVMMMGNGKGGTIVLARSEEQYREAIDLLLETDVESEEPTDAGRPKEGCGCPIYS